MRLCGISSRFQLLFPCIRQVTHALLTRPPLSHKHLHPEGICRKCFVRLACIKHAASVHPEPGSNSHVNVCSNQVQITLSYLYLFFYCFLVVVSKTTVHQSQLALSWLKLLVIFRFVSLFSYQGFGRFSRHNRHYIIIMIFCCQQLFYFLLNAEGGI